MAWWWLSFTDPAELPGQRFLGACAVEADSFLDAVGEAHRLGCNPGGEVAGQEFEEGVPRPPPDFTNRLLTREECGLFDQAMKRAAH